MDRFERHRSGLGRRRGVLHLRSRRRGERLGLRNEREAAASGDEVHRLRREGDRRGWRDGRLRAGRTDSRTRAWLRTHPRDSDHRHRRFPVDDAALGRRHQPDRQYRDLADRQTRRRRSTRRDLHDPDRQGRRAEPDADQRRGGAQPGLVARRQVHLLLQRSIGRIPARARGAGRDDAAARDHAAEADALLHALLVTGFEEAALHRHESQGVGARRRQRPGQGDRQRSVDGARAHAEPGVESGLEVGRVLEPVEVALPRGVRGQRGDG